MLTLMLEEHLTVLNEEFRLMLLIILWPLIIIGIIGNISVLYRLLYTSSDDNTCKIIKLLKPIYRGTLLSLALSDILLLTTSGLNVLANIHKKTLLWNLPDSACTAIPFVQTIAVLIASINLAVIAIDRYLAIKSKYPIVKNINWLSTVSIIILIWIVSSASSYPVLNLYSTKEILVVNNSSVYPGSLCITDRNAAAKVYTVFFGIIFIPLGTVFLLVHVLLALSISKRKTPALHQTGFNQLQINQHQYSSTNESNNLSSIKRDYHKKPTPIHIIRKRRTVRVILILIVVFAICRLPQWLFLLIKLHVTISGNFWWALQIILTTLSLLNATVNPFLYAFLNEALSIINWLNNFCCNWRNKTNQIKQLSIVEGSQTVSIKVPRGPYT